jgi:hypothetical protein
MSDAAHYAPLSSDTDFPGLYRLPVYAYLRRCGHAAAAAAGLAEAFLRGPASCVVRDAVRRRLARFLADPGPPVAREDAELESRYALHFPAALDAEACFERGVGLGVMAIALQALRREAAQSGRQDLFEALVPWLEREPRAGEYEPLARRLRVAPTVLHRALRRLRERFRELVDGTMICVVGEPAEMSARRSALQNVFSPE